MSEEYNLKKYNGKKYFCTVELSLQVIGGKWKAIILYHLMTGGIKRFSELKRDMPNITQKMLTQQLRELEKDNMVNRKVYPQVPPKVEYRLTEFGKTIMPILDSLRQWGQTYEKKYQIEK